MLKGRVTLTLMALGCLLALAAWGGAAVDTDVVTYSGKVVGEDGSPVRGATVSLFTADASHNVSVYSQEDGSFSLPAMPADEYRLRVRLIGLHDEWVDLGAGDETSGIEVKTKKASGWDLQLQRPAVDLISFLNWEDEKDSLNFKMMCAYCHQVGTLGFRSPEEPVDWEVMLTRMDGFQGLYKHTQDTLVDRVVNAFGREAEKTWPEYVPPEPPKGKSLLGEVREWTMGEENYASIHDIELGKDGLVYTVDMAQDAVHSLDPKTGERHTYMIPGGKEFGAGNPPVKGPHSIEMDADGNQWLTLALSGEMAMFDTKTKEFRVGSGHEAPRSRSGYPHTLRFDQKGILWWTDAALGVFSLDPKTWNGERWDVKFYKLPSADQVRGGGARGESRGVTPYGIDVAPNGHVWYSKLNGQRVGRVAPELADDHPDKIVEWKPPVHGPRRLHVAPNGIVWVPGWASGDLASFDPSTEEWAVYPLPKGPDALPYALNINPTDGSVWITGTGTDSMVRFDPESQEFVEYRMPTRVTYTREIEFDEEGNVWTCNSNGPTRHIENGFGSVIQLSLEACWLAGFRAPAIVRGSLQARLPPARRFVPARLGRNGRRLSPPPWRCSNLRK